MGKNPSRRTFLKLAGLAGVSIAASDSESFNNLIPWVVPPENIPPVIWNTLATTCRECPAGCGMHIMHKDGRITKAEGNPGHPVNRGGLCARGQSALQGIYDPDRVKEVKIGDRKGSLRKENWQNAFRQIAARLVSAKGNIAIISRLETGTIAEIMSGFLQSFGSERLIFYEAFNYEPIRKAHAALFGKAVIPYYQLDKCDYILSFGADFLETWVSNVQFAAQFSQIHSLKNGRVGRFDYVGPRLSMTAVNAEDFIQVSPGEETAVALALLKAMHDDNLLKKGREIIGPLVRDFDINSATGGKLSPKKISAMARRFALGSSAALAGPVGATGPEAERLAMAVSLLNYAAGRFGTVIDVNRPHALSNTATEEDMARFLGVLSSEDVLFIHKTNPVFTRPQTLEALKRPGMVVCLGNMEDETASVSDWLLPVNYDLESWGDYEPWPGVFSLLQPTMSPPAGSMDAGDFFLKLALEAGKMMRRTPAGPEIKNSYRWAQERWKSVNQHGLSEMTFTENWVSALRHGGTWKHVEGHTGGTPSLRPVHLSQGQTLSALSKNEAELWLWPSIMLFDGRTANRGWIQEAPEPVSYNTWGSWIDIHPKKAGELDIEENDVIELSSAGNRKIEVPARITVQVHEDTVALELGQGHTALGKNARLGVNGFMLLQAGRGNGFFGRVSIRRTGRKGKIFKAMSSNDQHGRDLMKWRDIETVRTMKPGKMILPLPEGYDKEHDLYAPHYERGHRWAMAIDLQRCIGCGACAVACYAENNIAVAGRSEVAKTRQMAWLKIIPYFRGKDPLRIGWLPVLCQQCDAAPCEPVCPVFAAVHNEEGLNAQIYNRCIGTRYCNNNCPYKVRRFNWLNHHWPEPLNWQLNPEVTVRSRGVMEKCTFCVQRIRNAEFRARREDRKIRDGEIQPACAQSCPAKVFTFGDLLDPNSEVRKIFFSDPRRYQLLQELNTKPAIAYLYRIEQENL